MFKDETAKKQSAVEKGILKLELEQDVINYDVIKKILIIYLATVAIPTF
jgi:hypothetical protein